MSSFDGVGAGVENLDLKSGKKDLGTRKSPDLSRCEQEWGKDVEEKRTKVARAGFGFGGRHAL